MLHDELSFYQQEHLWLKQTNNSIAPLTCCVTVTGSCRSLRPGPLRRCRGRSWCSRYGWRREWTAGTFLSPSQHRDKETTCFVPKQLPVVKRVSRAPLLFKLVYSQPTHRPGTHWRWSPEAAVCSGASGTVGPEDVRHCLDWTGPFLLRSGCHSAPEHRYRS